VTDEQSEPRAAEAVVHTTADVEPGAVVGPGTRVWARAHLRTGSRVGRDCTIGANVFVDVDVAVGDHCKIQNGASLFKGVRLADGVFVGPHAIFTNDRVPRAVNPDGSLKGVSDWTVGTSTVARGAAIGAGVVVLTGVTIGQWAMIGAGSIVTRNVEDHALVVGNPARLVGWVSALGARCASQREALDLTARETSPVE
jgi:UDP-2-acetamido-3-amino-2,3-dideoxy-glucuronate N-acetyltransferase